MPGTQREAYLAHRSEGIEAEFGEPLEQVTEKIRVLDQAGRYAEADRLRARLYRVNAYAVTRALNVEGSKRWKPRGGDTFCNVYSYDMVRALGAYLPRVWWYKNAEQRVRNGDDVAVAYGKTVYEMNADGMYAWMDGAGKELGWQRVDDMAVAQAMANEGRVAIILAEHKNGPGHVSVILPETEQLKAGGDEVRDDGSATEVLPVQSQAGSRNFNSRTGSSAWWKKRGYTGAAFVWFGGVDSPVATPEELGLDRNTDKPQLPGA